MQCAWTRLGVDAVNARGLVGVVRNGEGEASGRATRADEGVEDRGIAGGVSLGNGNIELVWAGGSAPCKLLLLYGLSRTE